MSERLIRGMDFTGERLKRSPFHAREKALNVRNAWSAWNGYKFADCYYDAEFEYFCIRNLCGTYDICPMQKYHVAGPDAEAMLNRMVTRDISKLPVDRVTYVVWCTDAGRVIDDGTIFRLAQDRFMLVCGSPCIAWLKMAAFGFGGVTVTDVSDDIAALALQGPTSCAVLRNMGLDGIERAKRFDIRHFPYHGDSLMVSRTGFTGDLGYELWVRPDLALRLWDELYAAGADFGIQPFGEEATNMARLEAGLIMPDLDFHEALKTVNLLHDQSPFELNLGWLVDFDKPHFNGRTALLQEKERGSEYTLTRLDIPGNKPAVEAILYNNRNCSKAIGYVTSAMWSPAVKANIAMAMIESKYLKGDIWVEIYHQKELRQYRKVVLATIRNKPFWAPARLTATPPPDY
jgi:aminomethyltransferase